MSSFTDSSIYGPSGGTAVKFDFVVNLHREKCLISRYRVFLGARDKVFEIVQRLLVMAGKDEKWVMIVKAKGPSGPAKIHSDDPKHALGLVQYLRTIGYTAWIEDTNGNEFEETVLKNAIKEMLHE